MTTLQVTYDNLDFLLIKQFKKQWNKIKNGTIQFLVIPLLVFYIFTVVILYSLFFKLFRIRKFLKELAQLEDKPLTDDIRDIIFFLHHPLVVRYYKWILSKKQFKQYILVIYSLKHTKMPDKQPQEPQAETYAPLFHDWDEEPDQIWETV